MAGPDIKRAIKYVILLMLKSTQTRVLVNPHAKPEPTSGLTLLSLKLRVNKAGDGLLFV